MFQAIPGLLRGSAVEGLMPAFVVVPIAEILHSPACLGQASRLVGIKKPFEGLVTPFGFALGLWVIYPASNGLASTVGGKALHNGDPPAAGLIKRGAIVCE